MASAAAAAAATSQFFGTPVYNPGPSLGRFQARFGFGFGKKSSPPPPPPKRAQPKFSSGEKLVWFPGAEPPEWLDGSMVGDRGFYPFRFAKPAEYLQFELDSLDQNLAKNVAGEVIGTRVEKAEVNPTPFQPYSVGFQDPEVPRVRAHPRPLGYAWCAWRLALHGKTLARWSWLKDHLYLGQPLPFSLTTLTRIEVVVIGYIELQRNRELDPEKRLYPGGPFFDALGLTKDPDEKEGFSWQRSSMPGSS